MPGHRLQPFNLRLGQLPVEIPFRVVVTDIHGDPFKDAKISAFSSGRPLYDVSTDSEGVASFPVGPFFPAGAGALEIVIQADGYVIRRQVQNTDETVFVTLPVCAPQPFITMKELAIAAVSGALVGSGAYFKADILKTLGELGLGAVVFSAVYRHSCGS